MMTGRSFMLHHTKKYLCLTIAIVLFCNVSISLAQQGWEAQSSNTDVALYGIDVISNETVNAVGPSGVVRTTFDGGLCWLDSDLYDYTIDALLAADFLDEDNGTVVGTSGAIFTTADGGLEWDSIQYDMTTTYYDVLIIDENTQIAFGENSIFECFVTRTQDGWATKESFNFLAQAGSVAYESSLRDACLKSDNSIWAVARFPGLEPGGVVVNSTDIGETWTTSGIFENQILALDFPTDNFGVVVGILGAAYRTTYGGSTWETLTTGIEETLLSVDFVSETTGWAVGTNGMIICTTDGGDTWTAQVPPYAGTLFAVGMFDDQIGWVVGDEGQIFKTINGGVGNTNLQPEEFARLSPEDFTEFPVGPIEFVWESTIDPEGEPIQYRFAFEANTFDTLIFTQDTTFTLDLTDRIDVQYTVAGIWHVLASDGVMMRAASNGPGNIMINPDLNNEPPSDFSLLTPLIGDTVAVGEVDFTWEESIDPDEDNLTYTLHLTTSGMDCTIVTELTNITIDFTGINDLTDIYSASWTLSVSDGEETVEALNSPGNFCLEPEVNSVFDNNSNLPSDNCLYSAYPNPFNPTTEISFDIVNTQDVKLTVFNTLGQEVTCLVNRQLQAGKHQVSFNANGLTSGVYFYRLEAGNYSAIKKMILMQ